MVSVLKNIAIIFNHPPHGTSCGRETLDLALALSDINQISVFFINSGVTNLLKNQQPDKILMRDYISTFSMLSLYDITNVYVCADVLLSLNITASELVIDAQAMTKIEMAKLLSKHDAIINI